MIGYIFDRHDFSVKGKIEVGDDYHLIWSASYDQISTIRTASVTVEKRDIIALYDQPDTELLDSFDGDIYTDASGAVLFRNPRIRPRYCGMVIDVETDERKLTEISLTSLVALFDEDVIAERPDITAADEGRLRPIYPSVERYIKLLIERNFANSSDTFTSLPYLAVETYTDTSYALELSKSGLINICDTLSALAKKSAICVEFVPMRGSLRMMIYRSRLYSIPIYANHPDVVSWTANESFKFISKITYRWKLKDGEGFTGAYTFPVFYLRSNGSMTLDASDPDRAEGEATAKNISAATFEEVETDARSVFAENAFEQKITAEIKKNGLIQEWYVSRPVRIPAGSAVVESAVTQITDDGMNTFEVQIGSLATTLTDKLRRLINE